MLYEFLVGGVTSISIFSLFVSVPLYVLVLIAVRNNRHVEPFNSEFFTIFIALGIADLACYILSLCKKLIFVGFVPQFLMPFNESNPYCPFLYYPFWVFGFMQYQLTFLLTLNRHFSIVMPAFYLQNWNSKCTRFFLLLSTSVSCILALPILISNCQISEYTAFGDEKIRTLRYGPYTTDKTIEYYFKSVWAFHVYGLIISSVLFYGLMLKKLRENKTILVGKRRRVEMQMFYAGFLLFALNLVFTVYFVLRDLVLIRFTTNTHIHEWILLFIADIYDLPNGYILWITSPRVRKIVYKLLGLESGLLKSGELIFSMLSTRHPNRVSAMPQSEPSGLSSNKF